MRCWNCNRKMPKDAKICAHCESPAMPKPTSEEMQAARALLEQLPPEQADELLKTMLESDTADEFVNRIFVGDCPKCESSNTGDCENDPEIGELLVGRCYDCGQLFCTECSRFLDPKAVVCECLSEDDFLEDEKEGPADED